MAITLVFSLAFNLQNSLILIFYFQEIIDQYSKKLNFIQRNINDMVYEYHLIEPFLKFFTSCLYGQE